MVKEIPINEFTAEKWGRLAETADRKCKPQRRFNPEHFFPEVQKMMSVNKAKAWSNEKGNAFLVTLYHTNLFSGHNVGLALFWVSLDGKSSTELMDTFHAEAARRGCAATYASAFRSYRSPAMARYFRRLGYDPHETGFVKMLADQA